MAAGGDGRVRRIGAATALLALALTGCTAPAQERPEPPPSSPTSSPTEPLPSVTPPDPEPSDPRPIRIALAGDVHFEGVLAGRLRDPATALAPTTSALAAADLAIVNLETSVGTGGSPEPGKRFTFSAGPAAFAALAAAGVDVATMANNHALDYGRARLPGTMRSVDAASTATPPLSVIGIGRNAEEAFAPALVDVRGTVVATLAASVADQDPAADPTGRWAATDERGGIADALDPARLLATVRRTRRDADVVVVYVHWGIQGQRCPSSDQRSLARALVDAGADIVAGSHAHQLQGDGRLGTGYVAYGLGNYAWYSPGDAATSRTGVLHLTVRPRASGPRPAHVVRAAWSPARVGTNGLPAPANAGDAADFRTDRESLRACAGLAR